jgi:hypothetical protein
MAKKRKRTPPSRHSKARKPGGYCVNIPGGSGSAAVLKRTWPPPIAARKVSQRLAKEQRFEAEDFADALKRFRSTG